MNDSELVNSLTYAKKKRNTLNMSTQTNSHTMIAKQHAVANVAKITEQLLSRGIVDSTDVPLEKQSLPQLQYSLIQAKQELTKLGPRTLNNASMKGPMYTILEDKISDIEKEIQSKNGYFSRVKGFFSRGGRTKRTKHAKRSKSKRSRHTRRK